MSQIPAELKYTKSHEWIRLEADGSLTIGITDHAQEALGDLVFVETPEAGQSFGSGDAAAVVESVKAASDVYAPVAGDVIGGNETLADAPETLNFDVTGNRVNHWFRKPLQPSVLVNSIHSQFTSLPVSTCG